MDARMRWPSGYRACGALIVAAAMLMGSPISSGADSAPASAPPRSVSDLLRVLETYKPDPARVAQLRAAVKQEPPVDTTGPALAEFFLGRGRAAWDLGLPAQAAADLDRAIALLPRGHPTRLRTLNDLWGLQWFGGNPSAALAASEQLIEESGPKWFGYRLAAYQATARIYASIGDFEAAKRAMALAEADYSVSASRNASSSFNYNPLTPLVPNPAPSRKSFLLRHTSVIEAARSMMHETQGEWREAEAAMRRALAAAQALVQTYKSQPSPDQPRVEVDQIILELRESGLASILANRGQLAEAEFFARAAARHSLERAGRYDPNTGMMLTRLAQVLVEEGRFTEAVALAREAVGSVEGSGAVEESRAFYDTRHGLVAALVARGATRTPWRSSSAFVPGRWGIPGLPLSCKRVTSTG